MVSATHTCPVCGGAGEVAFTACDRNREVTDAQFSYARCRTCATLFLPEPPADLHAYYADGYYPIDERGEPYWKSDDARKEFERWRVALLARFVSPGALIEVGAGAGAFSVACRDAGYTVTAIEMDERCCRSMQSEGVNAICSDDPVAQLAALPPARVVAMWHVLEHLATPAQMLEAVAATLEPGGLFAVAVPNIDSLQHRVLGTRWPHLDAPRHISLLSPRALSTRCAELGLRRVFATTGDPEGRNNDSFAWVYGLSRRPARNASGPGGYAGVWLSRLLAPYERRALRGSSLTALFRKER